MEELKVGNYIRTPKGIAKIEEITEDRTEIYFNCDTGLSISFIKKDFTQEEMAEFYKHSHNIIDLIDTMDLLFVDIDNGYEGGIIVPKIAETMNELNEIKSKIKSGNLKLKYIVTREQIENLKYEVE